MVGVRLSVLGVSVQCTVYQKAKGNKLAKILFDAVDDGGGNSIGGQLSYAV